MNPCFEKLNDSIYTTFALKDLKKKRKRKKVQSLHGYLSELYIFAIELTSRPQLHSVVILLYFIQ